MTIRVLSQKNLPDIFYVQIGKHANYWKDVFSEEYWRGYVVRWEHLPDVVLEQIMGYLNIPDKHNMSQVCRNWYRAFHLPRCWRHFVLHDRTLTKRKYTRYFGYIHELDHYRMQFCLQKVCKLNAATIPLSLLYR